MEEEVQEEVDWSKVVPCLVCGVDLKNNRVVVKTEVSDENSERTANINLLEEDQLTGANGGAGGDQSVVKLKWTPDEKTGYQWFVKWFHLHLEVPRKNINLGWNVEGDCPFPFCGPCKDQLLGMVELQRKVEELEEKIRDGVELMKSKVNLSEEVFGKMGVYKRDKRYLRARRQIVPDFNSRYPDQPGIFKLPFVRDASEVSRKSTRLDARKGDRVSSKRRSPVVWTSEPDDQRFLSPGKKEDATEPSKPRKRGRKKKTHHVPESNLPIVPKLTPNDTLEYEPSFDNEDTTNYDLSPAPVEDFLKNRNDADFHPPSSPEPSSRTTRRKRKASLKLKSYALFDDDDEEDQDFTPTPPKKPSTSKRGRTPKPVPDEDWRLDPDLDSEPDQSPDASEDSDVDLDDFTPTGKPRNIRVIHDPVAKTYTYESLTFTQLEPFSSNLCQCTTCGAQVSSKRLRYHYLRAHSSLYRCKLCHLRFENSHRLKSHVATIHQGIPKPPKRFTKECPICAKPIGVRNSVKCHVWTHFNAEERRVAIASGSNSVPGTFLRPHQCESCGKRFPTPSTLRRHKKVVHVTAEEKEKSLELCPTCGGTFYNLKDHQKNAHGSDPHRYVCMEDNCGKGFKQLALLRKHKDAVHRNLKTFQCSICPRAFSTQKILDVHVNLHLGVRPWKCDHCPMAFSRKEHAQRHTKVYHSEGSRPKRKPFQRGATMLAVGMKKEQLVSEGKYLPPSALATWAAGREPTSHFVGVGLPEGFKRDNKLLSTAEEEFN